MSIEQIASAECDALHNQLFGFGLADDAIRQDYVRVARTRFSSGTELALSRIIVGQKLNAQAIEYYWRLRWGKNPLTHRFEVVAMLCEATPGYSQCFLNEQPRRVRGWLLIGALPFKCVSRFTLGAWQCFRHGIRL